MYLYKNNTGFRNSVSFRNSVGQLEIKERLYIVWFNKLHNR